MAVKLRASKVQTLAATTPTYLDYEGLVELVSKLKATYATQLSLDDYLTISAAASTYQPVGDYALKTDIPTNVSAFTNDAGYITAADVVEPDLSGYVTTSSLATTLADYAKTSDLPTLSSLGGVGSVSASGTSPLTLSASKSGTDVTITGSVDLSSYVTSSSLTSTLADYAKSSDIPTLSSLSGIGTVNASGTSPLTLSASKSGTTVTITGSVDLSAYATTSDLSSYVTSSSLTSTLADYAKTSDMPTLSSLGGIDTVTASGTSPLTLSASKSGTSVTISGSVDLSSYATQSWVQEQIADAVSGGTVDLSEYATKSWVEEQLAGFTSDGITSISMTGDSVLSFNVSESNGAVVITGSADTYTKSEISSMISTAAGGGITGATANATSPLSLSTSVSDGLLTITGSVDLSDYAKMSDLSSYVTSSSLDSTLSSYAKTSDIPTLSSLGGIDTVTASGSGNLSLSASKSGTSVTISGSVDLSDYATQAWVQEQITDAVTGGTVDLSAYLTKSEAASTYQPIGDYTTSSDFKTINGNSIIGSGDITITGGGDVDLSEYAKIDDVMESFVEIAESNMLTERNDGVTLRLSSYYPKTLGDANGSCYSDVTFKTVAGESIFGSGDVTLDDFADKASIISMARALYTVSSRISTNSSETAINFYGWEPTGDWLTGTATNTVTINFKTVNGYPIIGSGDITIDSPGTATADELGLVRPWYDTNLGSNAENLLDRQINEQSTTTGRYYGISAVNGRLYVNVPWEGSDVDLSDYADRSTTMSMMQSMMTSLSYEKGSDHAMHINYSKPTDWGNLEHGSTDYLSIHFVTLNGRSLFGMGDIDYSIEDLGGYSAATIDQKLADIAGGGTITLDGYATKDEVIGMAKSQYNAFTVSRSTSTNYTTIYHNFWLPNTIDTGEEDRVFGLYFANINGNSIVGTSSSQVGNLTISDLGGVSTDELADYADKSGTLSLMQAMAHDSELTYINDSQWLQYEMFYPDAWGESSLDYSQKTHVFVRTIAGQHIFGDTDNIDPTPWAVKIDGNSDIPGANMITMSTSSYSGIDYDGLAYYNGCICPYVLNSSNNATVYTNWVSETALKYNDSTGSTAEARKDIVFIYDDAAYVYNGSYLAGIGENFDAEQATLNALRDRYPSATLLDNLDLWFENLGTYGPSKNDFTSAKIMDYDADSGTCRIRFGVKDSEEQVYVIRSNVEYTNYPPVDSVVSSTTPSSGNYYIAYFDLILPYNGSSFVGLNYRYCVEYFND